MQDRATNVKLIHWHGRYCARCMGAGYLHRLLGGQVVSGVLPREVLVDRSTGRRWQAPAVPCVSCLATGWAPINDFMIGVG